MSRQLLFVIVVLVFGAMVWSKLRIAIFVNLSLWQAIGLFAVVSFVLFLALDHLINRRR